MADLVVRFRKPAGWADSVHIHYWDIHPLGQSTTWPGESMEKVDGWFVHRFKGGQAASFVFHDGNGRQTRDLHRDRSGWYTGGGTWDEQPPGAQAAAPTPGESPKLPKMAPAPRSTAETSGLPDFREETIYFLLTTRFFDGDPSNNFFCRDRIRFNAAGEAEDPHWRGDFKGLIHRLDYIRDLGVTAIWLLPFFPSPLRDDGYDTSDYVGVNPIYGSLRDFKALKSRSDP